MIYYRLTNTVDPKIVGVTDGAGQVHIEVGDFLERNQWYKSIFHETELAGKDWWKPWAEITKYAQPLYKVFMEKKAKHTDYIDFSMRGFAVNNQLREILESSHLPQNHKFLQTTFIQKEKIVDGYWWFVYDMDTGEQTVDFAKCEYDLRYHKRNFGENFAVNIQTYQEYMNVFYETGSAVGVSKLVFNQNFDQELDLFGMQFLGSKNYISDRLLKKMEANRITGYEAISPERDKRRSEFLGYSSTELIFS
ncbi:imm11 family protein [Siphonobacter sp. SORGH_AS_0500]|uniref:imm11 family protein n=1 Tax=Siphonobacter sp. SORGH_AS_0500 TaxID=1864824 RepID=UPI002866BE06|nr:DUF1629 domain-containing protein [Siphonobacter sp. SORGH_AS_0500]MDR6194073.1 hypothetical protein [Siphonobacter sp. SORGH_AS_0500]